MTKGIERVRGAHGRSAWATAKVRLLDYWDHPPAVLFWLAFTAITIAVLKGVGL